MAFVAPRGGLVRGQLLCEPRVNLGSSSGFWTWNFTNLTGTAQNVYQDGNLTTVFSPTGVVTADVNGLFPPIYLDSSLAYAVTLKDNLGNTIRSHNPLPVPLSYNGTSQNTTFGLKMTAFQEFALLGNTGGTGNELTINAPPGGAAIRISSPSQNGSALIINTSVTTGAQTASFASNNKPGSGVTTINATVAPTGATYTGGTLTSPFLGPTGNFYTITLSTGQVINNCTFTFNSTTFVTPSTSITGNPTTALNVSPQFSGPVVWVPVLADGVQYYAPAWRGDNFIPVSPPPTTVGSVILATTATFNADGSITVTGAGASASPPNWFLPTTPGVGSQYWLGIFKNSGLSGINFTAANGTYANITSSGLAVASSGGNAPITGLYNLSTNSLGTNIVASGTITLSGATGGQSNNISGFVNWVLAGNGTSTLGGSAINNWFLPTTASTGHLYWLNITRTGGTSGSNFDHAQGAWTNITDSGITIGLTNVTGSTTVNGTYQIASDSGGVNVVASGTVQLTASVQTVNYSGNAPLVLAGNGTATLGGSATTNWFTPTTTNIGGGMWINITRTSGTTGVNFSAAQGSFTNITNSGITISLTNVVGNCTASGTYQISSNSGGTQLVTQGSISLTKNISSLIHVYTSGSGATETIPIGATNMVIEDWGGGGGGGGGTGVGSLQGPGAGGGSGGYCRDSKVLTSANWGQTLHYTVGAGGAAGVAGTGSSVSSGTYTLTTMSAGGGGFGVSPSSPGAGGTASGGTAANTAGNIGQTKAQGGAGGAGISGTVSGDGSPYGAGGHSGFGAGGAGHAGSNGAVVFYYT